MICMNWQPRFERCWATHPSRRPKRDAPPAGAHRADAGAWPRPGESARKRGDRRLRPKAPTVSRGSTESLSAAWTEPSVPDVFAPGAYLRLPRVRNASQVAHSNACSSTVRPRGSPQNRPVERIRNSHIFSSSLSVLESSFYVESSSPQQRDYADLAWAKGSATQGCDRSADPAAGMAWWRRPPQRNRRMPAKLVRSGPGSAATGLD
jgi:hypothetical protein